jgi:ubiquinone/menaquinone biosynthesis C-methylase UbiE
MTTDPQGTAPNHHAHHPGFSGPKGLALGVLMAAKHRARGRLAVRLMGVGPGDTVVDVGSGPGGAVRLAARAGATAIGVEPSSVMRRIAKALSLRQRGARWLDGAAESIPVAEGTATIVWSIATVHHWPHLEEGIDEVRRVLGSQGRFLAIERKTVAGAQGVASHGWTEQQAADFAARCEAAGFVSSAITYHQTDDGEAVAVIATAP